MINIPQQNRDRTDKQFVNFISQPTQKPRTYNEQDILVYRTVFALREKGEQRPQIMIALAKLVKTGQLTFYPNEIYSNVDIILMQHKPEQGTPAKLQKQEKTEKRQQSRKV